MTRLAPLPTTPKQSNSVPQIRPLTTIAATPGLRIRIVTAQLLIIRAPSNSNPIDARAYYNRAVLKKEKGDAPGAAADFKRAQKLDPELVSEGSAPESSSNRGTANGEATG